MHLNIKSNVIMKTKRKLFKELKEKFEPSNLHHSYFLPHLLHNNHPSDEILGKIRKCLDVR